MIRRWKEGDKFQPLGMKGMKKVSDFLIDAKVPIYKKEEQLVMLSEDKVIWLVGRRIDERYKVLSKGEENIKISFISNS